MDTEAKQKDTKSQNTPQSASSQAQSTNKKDEQGEGGGAGRKVNFSGTWRSIRSENLAKFLMSTVRGMGEYRAR
eukprot:827859-Amorphochlora_amoeboformis.AAC.2